MRKKSLLKSKFQPKDKRFITSPNVDGKTGSFTLESPFSFEKCRERFAASFKSDTIGFYFLHNAGYLENVALFLLRTEEILEVPSSEFALTNREYILYIEPSMFWRECSMKRSLLTILLLCGMVYDCDKNNYEEALFSHEYIKRTNAALMRFMFGFTRYTGPALVSSVCAPTLLTKGWVSTFDQKEPKHVREMLVLPEEKEPLVTMHFGDALWC